MERGKIVHDEVLSKISKTLCLDFLEERGKLIGMGVAMDAVIKAELLYPIAVEFKRRHGQRVRMSWMKL
jgi:hypothetical protein